MKKILIVVIITAALISGGCEKQDKQEISADSKRVPVESEFRIEGEYGCLAPIPYKLRVSQKGRAITYTLNDKKQDIKYEKFERFWQICKSINPDSLGSSYGSMKTTADFRGTLTIEVKTERESIEKKIEFIRGSIENEGFRRLINSMMEMVEAQDRLPKFGGDS